jgi:O-antigen/teichoic acid export membrane protein
MLAPDEFGICVAVMAVLGTADLVTDVSLDKFLISHPRDDQQVLATAHKLSIARGFILALGVFVAAPAIAALFGASTAVGSFRSLSVLLLIRGFTHLDIKQVQRYYRYAAETKTNAFSQLAGVAAVYPAVLMFHDHRAIVMSLSFDAGVYLLASHFFARSPYSAVAIDRRLMRDALAFGLPLTVNGIGLAIFSQFDRGIVSHWLGLETLALYAVIMSMAVVPVSIILRVLGTLSLPFLARARQELDTRANAYVQLQWICSVIGAAYAVFVAGTLDRLVPTVFGSTYSVSPLTHSLITLIAWARITRCAPVTLMLANGQTRRLTASTLVYGVGLLIAVLILPFIPRLETILIGLLIGEVLTDVVAFWVTRQRSAAGSRAVLGQLFWSLATAALGAIAVYQFSSSDLWFRMVVLSALAIPIMGTQIIHGLSRYLFHNQVMADLS